MQDCIVPVPDLTILNFMICESFDLICLERTRTQSILVMKPTPEIPVPARFTTKWKSRPRCALGGLGDLLPAHGTLCGPIHDDFFFGLFFDDGDASDEELGRSSFWRFL